MLNRILKSSSGMTLLEVMMAIAVFGIILTISVNVYGFIGRYNAYTLDQLGMAEQAQSKIEKILFTESITSSSDDSLVKVESPIGGSFLKVHAGDNYFIGAWVPPQKTIEGVPTTPDDPRIPEDPTEDGGAYNEGSWSEEIDEDIIKNWEIVSNEGEDPYITTTQGSGSNEGRNVYYKTKTFTPDFTYKVDATLPNIPANNSEAEIGMSISDVNKARFRFFLAFEAGKSNGDLKIDYPGYEGKKNESIVSNISLDLDKKLYFKANFSENLIKLYFGYYDDSGVEHSLINDGIHNENDEDVNIQNDVIIINNDYSTTGKEYYLGLYDKTAQAKMHYTLPTLLKGSSGEEGDCDL